ncbi:MAG: tetratricopeptide repeat protein [Planctomycetaceae bacterium]
MSLELDPTAIAESRCGAPELIQQADALAALGDWSSARALYSNAMTADPSPESLHALAVFLADGDQYDEAIALLEQAWNEACRQANPHGRAVCCGNLAIVHRRRGDMTRAVQFHQLSLAAQMETREFPMEASLTATQLWASAAQFSDEGDHDSAAGMLSAARGLSASNSEADGSSTENGMAVLLARQGLMETAVRVLLRGQNRTPNDLDAIFGKAPNVEEVVLEALRSFGWHQVETEGAWRAHDLLNLGHLLQGTGRLTEAVWCFRAASGLFDRAGAEMRGAEARQFGREARRRAVHRSADPLEN